jgi:ABC-type arginine transport system permease subunit
MMLLEAVSPDFLVAFLRGFSLNLGASVIALAIGLSLALVTALGMMSRVGILARLFKTYNRLLHALPVFVVLFFLSGLLPNGGPRLGPLAEMRPLLLLVLGNIPYVAAYGADQFVAMFRHLRQGDRRAALLVIPSFGRALQVVISTSCLGAAIGVPEAMSVVIFTAEQITDEAARLIFFVAVGLLFIIAQRICVTPFVILHRVADWRACRCQ